MSDTTMYTSKFNYNPGRGKTFPAGAVFSADQWRACGGTSEGLDRHVSKGYIVAIEVEVPKKTVPEKTVPEKTVPEKTVPEVSNTDDAPTGIWDFNAQELQDVDLKILNLMYKDRAKQFELTVEPMTDKDALIAKLCSESSK